VLVWVIWSPLLTGAAVLVWEFLFLSPCVPLQARVVKLASEGPNLASTLNQSAFNIGNALGPTRGAAALSVGVGYRWLPSFGSTLAITGVFIAILALVTDSRATTPKL
jgi:MFS transporter, DHA1 family, inner membrane transport protein